MTEQAKLLFYTVNKCGYYKFGEDDPEFGDLHDTLQDLFAWVHDGKTLGQTCTYEVGAGDVLRTFCFDMVKNSHDDYLLTTWNETPSIEGKVASVSSGLPVGSANVHLTNVPRNAIPGYATYFWFVPEHNLLATVRFQHALNGNRNLNQYLKEFLAKWSSYVVISDDRDVDHPIAGYRPDSESEIVHVRPTYKSSVLRRPGSIQTILRNRSAIRKILRKNLLRPQVVRERTLFRTLLGGMGLENPQASREEIKVKYEVEHTPTEAELHAMILAWESEHETGWDDIGFQFQSESEVHWLSHSFTKYEAELEVLRQNPEVVSSQSLLSELSSRRRALLRKAGVI